MPLVPRTAFRLTTPLLGVLFAFGSVFGQTEGEVAAAPTTEATESAPIPTPIDTALHALLDAETTPEDRSAAAQLLIATDDATALEVIEAVLHDAGPGAMTLADTIESQRPKPDRLVPVLTRVFGSDHEPARRIALRVLLSWRTKEAIGGVIERLAADPILTVDEQKNASDRLRSALALPLGTGPTTDDAGDWGAWWDTARGTDDVVWALELAERHEAIASERALALDETTRALRTAYRRLYALLPEAERSPFIAELLRSHRRAVRELGHDIALQSLLNARTLGPEVREVALEGASERDLDLRRRSAALLERLGLGTDSEAPRVLAWLGEEDDDACAASLLRLAAREDALGVEEAALPTMRWLANGPTTLDPALNAALALHAKGVLTDDQTAALAGVAQRALLESASALRVRAVDAVGDETLLLPLLGEGGDLALAVARALVDSPEHLDALVEAARSDDRLFPFVSDALVAHRATPEGLATLRSLPAPSATDRTQASARLVRTMTLADQITALDAVTDPAERVTLFAHAGQPGFFAQETDLDARVVLALALARAELATRDPAGALAALDLVPEPARTDATAAARVHALLWLGRLDDARAVREKRPGLPATAWIAALEDAIDLAHASDIAQATVDLYGAALTEAEQVRLDALVARLAQNTLDQTPSPSALPPTE